MKPLSFEQAEHAIQALLSFLTQCRPKGADADRIAAADVPVNLNIITHMIIEDKVLAQSLVQEDGQWCLRITAISPTGQTEKVIITMGGAKDRAEALAIAKKQIQDFEAMTMPDKPRLCVLKMNSKPRNN